MTDLNPINKPDRGALSTRPQRMGILPTWWFWREETNWSLVRTPASILAGGLVFFLAVSGLSPVVAGVVALLLLVFAFGSFERYIRKRTA